jgi:hypothetical protein
MYFILKYHYGFKEISNKAKEIYKEFYNEKLFKEQLSWFKDIDYSEPVTFVKEKPAEDEIKQFLIEVATTAF